MKHGRSLELLVEKLERQLSGNANVVIESPKKIPDIQTGKLREHDVVLTFSQSHHEIIIAIECKDRSRPVGVPDIEAFDNKCRYTNINQGIIVSSSGFCKTALDKASGMGIKCLELKEVDATSFLLPETIMYVHTKNFIEAKYTPMVNNFALRISGNYDIFDPEDNLITDEIIKNNINLIQDKLPFGVQGEEITESIHFGAENYYVVTREKKLKHTITGILLTIRYVHEVSESLFTSRRYMDAKQDSLIAEIATAPVSIDGVEREFTVIGKQDGKIYQFIS